MTLTLIILTVTTEKMVCSKIYEIYKESTSQYKLLDLVSQTTIW